MIIAVVHLKYEDGAADAVFQIGKQTISTRVREFRDGPVEAINFDDPSVSAIVSMCGISRDFCNDYWQGRRGEGRPLPWSYGVHEREQVERALEHGRAASP